MQLEYIQNYERVQDSKTLKRMKKSWIHEDTHRLYIQTKKDHKEYYVYFYSEQEMIKAETYIQMVKLNHKFRSSTQQKSYKSLSELFTQNAKELK